MAALDIAEVAIFAVLFFPSTYCLVKHGRPGLIGWFYLCAFCIIRIVGNAMLISNEENGGVPSVAALIVSSLGVAPLLLASHGILHEARGARVHRLAGWRELALDMNYHALLVTGVVLVAVGVANSYSARGVQSTSALTDAGLGILDLCWVLLAVWTVVSALPSRRRDYRAAAVRDGTKLLHAVLASLPLTCLRVIYATLYYTSDSLTVHDSLALKVCLSSVPEMLVAVLFVVAGIVTRDMSWAMEREQKSTGQEEMK